MSHIRNRTGHRVQVVACVSPTTCGRCTGRVRRRLRAVDVLVTRLVLLGAAGFALVFLLVTTTIAQSVGVVLVLFAVLAGGRAAVRAFGRSWKGEEGPDGLPR